MATQDDIFTVRLRISDPQGFTTLEEVTTQPATGASQTAYLLDSVYYAFESTVWTEQELFISDTTISGFIDAGDTNTATVKSIKLAIAQLGREMRVKSLSGGVDTTEYQSMSDMLAFYKSLKEMYAEDVVSTNTGRMFHTYDHEIAGGNL